MSFSERLDRYGSRLWRERRALLGETGERADGLLRDCGGEELIFLRHVLATLPLSDLEDCDLSLLRDCVREALAVREEFPWCGALPGPLFLLYVLYPRINNEELAPCRALFREALADRVRGLSLSQAILEVNRWCAENVTYRSTDDRTASALDVFRCGWGRCGEESVFAVNALRSVGIAARQIYAPWWSHCDDNHAWVEAWDGEKWRYLGACEPEPELDRGWFPWAASRAVMIHARCFLPGSREEWDFLFPEVDPQDLRAEDGVVYETVTPRYGETRLVTVTVEDGGVPVPGARVAFSVLNMAGYAETAAKETGEDGKACLRLGLGSVLVSASREDGYGEMLADLRETGQIRVSLHKAPAFGETWEDFRFAAPAGMNGYPEPLPPEKKKLREAFLDSAAALREQRKLKMEMGRLSPEESRVFGTLSEKDRAQPPRKETLTDSLPAFIWEKEFPSHVFEKAFLSPRIGTEPLFPWRRELAASFSEEERQAFRRDPSGILVWMEKNLREAPSYPVLCASPAGSFRLKATNALSFAVLFCALCRSVGVPARLSPLDGRPEYWRDGAFCRVGEEETACLALRAPEDTEALPRGNYGLSRFTGQGWQVLETAGIPAGGCRELSLTPGVYRLITTARLPGGDQLCRQAVFNLEPGERREVLLSFRKGRAEELLDYRALPPFSLESSRQGGTDSAALLAGSPVSLLIWPEPSREPTEHILNELREAAAELRTLGCAVHLILQSPEQEKDPALERLLAVLPEARLWVGDFRNDVPLLARRMFLDPDKLPLVLLADCKGNGLYASGGYNVGTARLLPELLKAWWKNNRQTGESA